MSKLFAYARCSHQDSAASGLSIESQLDAIRRYVAAMPIQVEWAEQRWPDTVDQGVFTDEAQSAWKKNLSQRPAGKLMSSSLQSGDHVAFYSIDRGFRSILDFSKTIADWAERGIVVHLVSERFNLMSANGKLLANIFASFAQWKSDILSERLREIACKRKAGQPAKKLPPRWENPEGIDLTIDTQPAVNSKAGTVYSYARVSHAASAASGLSMDAQRQITERYAASILGCERGRHFEELAVSGFNIPFFSRPAGGDLNGLLKRGDHVVFARMDRGWRNLRDMIDVVAEWESRGVSVHLADTMLDTSSATGKIFMKVMSMLAEWESQFISDRTRMAMKVLKKQGRQTNQKVPMGCTRVVRGDRKSLKIDPAQVRDMWFIAHLRDNHSLSWSQVSDVLEKVYANREGRAEIPATGGREVRRKVERLPSQLHIKTLVENRKWGKSRCQKAYQRWNSQLKAITSQIASQKVRRMPLAQCDAVISGTP